MPSSPWGRAGARLDAAPGSFGAATSSLPSNAFLQSNEDVAAPFDADTRSGFAHPPESNFPRLPPSVPLPPLSRAGSSRVTWGMQIPPGQCPAASSPYQAFPCHLPSFHRPASPRRPPALRRCLTPPPLSVGRVSGGEVPRFKFQVSRTEATSCTSDGSTEGTRPTSSLQEAGAPSPIGRLPDHDHRLRPPSPHEQSKAPKSRQKRVQFLAVPGLPPDSVPGPSVPFNACTS